jgi:hypothetical protein
MSKSGLLSFDAHLTELEAAKKQASRKNPSHLDFIDKFMLPSLDFGVACKNMTGSSGFCHTGQPFPFIAITRVVAQ